MPPRPDTSRDLLAGLLALQSGLIDPSSLVAAFGTWTGPGGRPLAEILVDRGDLDDGQRARLVGLAAEALTGHGGDTEGTPAAPGAGPTTRRDPAGPGETGLDTGLDSLATALPAPDDRHPAAGVSLGSATSGGQRFRVLRPHARGGLGAVFVALDGELNREVALKQILDRHADEAASRSRFLVEAEITGGLEHPGIVPVYGLGHDPEGRPYYAMRFIRGDSLKEAIAAFHGDEALKSDPGRRSLALRNLLRRFGDVCDAIEYAHSRGVLHRDIKPANIIVGRHGETLVVDWGLAKATGRDDPGAVVDERRLRPSSSGGSSETLPGAAVGTPAYMSPEQAAGDLGRLGPRSDVYSLGATLYSILTGRPPFEGRDLGVLLRAVQEADFPPPRGVDPSIDPALEAACLKAMANDPEARYASPRALADDLERWSADEPVSAHSEPFARRARRWARRHRTAVTAASATTTAAMIGLAVVLAVQSRANRDLGLKNGELVAANARAVRANAELGGANARLVAANLREAKANADLKAAGERVQSRFDLARESIRAFATTVADDGVLKEERFRPLRDRLLRSAAEFHGKLGALLEGQGDRRSRLALAESYRSLARLVDEIGAKPEALAVCRKELAARRELASGRDPGDLLEMVDCLMYTGRIAYQVGAGDEALSAWEEVGRIIPAGAWPRGLADRAEAELARSLNNIGYLRGAAGEPARALEAYRRALAIKGRLAAAHPDVDSFQSDLAIGENNIAHLLGQAGEPARALEAYRRALAILERLASARPAVAKRQSDLAKCHNNIGTLLDEVGEPGRALEAYRRALEILEGLAAANPAVNEFQASLATGCNNLGFQLDRAGDPTRALESHRRALAIRERLAAANPSVIQYQVDAAGSHHNIGTTLDEAGERARALGSHRRALAIRERLAADHPATPSLGVDLWSSLAAVGLASAELGKADEASDSLRRAVAMEGRLPGDPGTLYLLACCHARLAGAASRPDPGSSAEGDRAVRALGRAISAGYRDLGRIRGDRNLDPLRGRADFRALLMDLVFPARPFAG